MNIDDHLNNIGKKSLIAANQVKSFSTKEKNNLLVKICEKISLDEEQIIEANKKDISIASGSIDSSMLDRLTLSSDRIKSIIK